MSRLRALVQDLRLSRRRGRQLGSTRLRGACGFGFAGVPLFDEVALFEAVLGPPSPFVLKRFSRCASKRAPARSATQVLVNRFLCAAMLDLQQVHH